MSFLYIWKVIKSFKQLLQTFVSYDILYSDELRWSYEST